MDEQVILISVITAMGYTDTAGFHCTLDFCCFRELFFSLEDFLASCSGGTKSGLWACASN